jgi:hypothetical protein
VSDIIFTTINENFPIAGQDNDTQVFRDNFDSIKTALSVAKTEITALEGNGEIDSGSARRDTDNNFNGNTIQNATFLNNVETVNPAQQFDVGQTTYTLDHENGAYQIFTFTSSNFEFDFLNFPQLGEKVGKITIEMYSSTSTTVTFSLSGSGASTIKKNSSFPGTLTVASSTNPIIIEIWRHSESNFFMNYLGAFN